MLPQILLPEVKSKEKIYWTNLLAESTSLAVYEAAKRHDGPLLYIAKDGLEANQLKEQLAFFNEDQILKINTFSDWETLPYDQFSPHPDIISTRLALLAQLKQIKKGIIIVTVSTLMHRLPPPEFLNRQSLVLKKGDHLDVSVQRSQLERSGYHCVNQVYQHGEFSIRGSIIDLFPMGSELPYRIDLFDNEIDSIRTFEPESQRSLEQVEKIELLPAHEFPFDEAAINSFRQNWRKQFEGNPLNAVVYQDVSQSLTPAGIEYYFPLFFEETATIFDYLSPKSLVIYSSAVTDIAANFWQEVKLRYEQLAYDIQRPILPPIRLFTSVDELLSQLHQFLEIVISAKPLDKQHEWVAPVQLMPSIEVDARLTQPWQRLLNFINENPKIRILFCAESEGRVTLFRETLAALHIDVAQVSSWQDFVESDHRYAISTALFIKGFFLVSPELMLLPEAYLLGQASLKRQRSKGSKTDNDAIIRNLSELKMGSPVVHLEHGVGRYLGLQTLIINELQSEFLALEYAGGDKLYVPVSSLNLISRYSGLDAEHAPLHRLGTDQWQKAKRKAKEQIRDVAAELLRVYARRAAKPGYQFSMQASDYEAFSQTFPFEETEDQEKAISQVILDMTSERAMDRLVCGDVGFGKTEVAMRAAFIAVQNHKQVVVLVPTTLLAQQHYETFKDRFAHWPIHVAVMSRFQTKKQLDETLQKIKLGTVDVVIGTHRLLQKDLQFKDLGLVVVDEEHRFGVQQKDKLKQLRAEVDILTLTATPIPRTLNMSLSGVRDLSIIATPPAKRLSIKTFVREKNSVMIREAILREIYRGGQVYYLHNEVETIEPVLLELQKLVPEANFAIAHGQMHERELEKIMSDFYHRRFNVLICTTIIETGIDVPAANTIIINKADRFGLAQLHQLRGRVGRSHHQAYAYLMVSSFKGLTADAKKRLDAIAALEDLGAGFTLAMHDLEIRGAGELLGEEQSGSMEAIGFSLYMELLDQAVNALKEGRALPLELESDEGVEVDLQIPALLPDNYVFDVNERLMIYKRIASSENSDELKNIQVELIDRFGMIPNPAYNLFHIAELKILAKKMGIKKIEMHARGGRIEFIENPSMNVDKLFKMVMQNQKTMKFDGSHRVRFHYDELLPDKRISFVKQFLENIR